MIILSVRLGAGRVLCKRRETQGQSVMLLEYGGEDDGCLGGRLFLKMWQVLCWKAACLHGKILIIYISMYICIYLLRIWRVTLVGYMILGILLKI